MGPDSVGAQGGWGAWSDDVQSGFLRCSHATTCQELRAGGEVLSLRHSGVTGLLSVPQRPQQQSQTSPATALGFFFPLWGARVTISASVAPWASVEVEPRGCHRAGKVQI